MDQATFDQSNPWDENTVQVDDARREQECEDFGRALGRELIEFGPERLRKRVGYAMTGAPCNDTESLVLEFAERWGWASTLRIVAALL